MAAEKACQELVSKAYYAEFSKGANQVAGTEYRMQVWEFSKYLIDFSNRGGIIQVRTGSIVF